MVVRSGFLVQRALGVLLAVAMAFSATACGGDGDNGSSDPCAALTCGANAACATAADGTASCACDAGYEGDGTTCTDIDECTTDAHDCDANAACANSAGAFTCACNDGYTGDGKTCTEFVAKTWTVFVYGQADSNISADLADNIQEMSKATLSGDINVVVMVDWNSSLPNSWDPICADGETACPNLPEKTQWLRIRGNGAEPEIMRVTDEIDSTDPAELSAAVEAAFTEFPADRYAVMLWNHGGSWDGGYGSDVDDGKLDDGTNMTHVEATSAVKAGLAAAGIEGTRPLSFFFFDTCLMGNVEVAYAARELAKVYVGNAEVDFGSGLNYRAFLSSISASPAAALTELAKEEVTGWGVRHKSKGLSDNLLRSHVALDTTKLEGFAAAMKAVADVALADWPNLGGDIARNAYETRPAYSVELSSGEPAESYRDVGQFLATLATSANTDLAAKATAAQAALEALIIAHDAGTLRDGAGQSGLSIALPIPESFTTEVATSYDNLAGAWSTATGWGQVLRAFDPAGTDMPSAATTLLNGTAPDADNLPGVTVEAGDTAAEVVIEIAESIVDERWRVYGVLGTFPIDPATGTVTASWDLEIFALPDGAGGTQPITIRRFLPGGIDAATSMSTPSLVLVPGLCDFSDSPSDCDLVVRPDTREVLVLIDRNQPEQPVTYDISELPGQFPGLTFTPIIDTTDQTGAPVEPSEGTPFEFPSTGVLTVERVAAPQSLYSIVTNVFDYYGRRVTLFDDFNY
ncbi:MAG: clostripain-related cysteine peptidase [Myxococcota bacterium]